MSVSPIQLPPFLLADLYRDVLIEPAPASAIETTAVLEVPGVTEQPAAPLAYLGKNQQHICFVVVNKNFAYMADDVLAALTKILGAAGLTLADVAVVNIAQTPVSFAEISQVLAPRSLVVFGAGAESIQLPFQVPHFQIQSFKGCHIMLSPTLESMMGNTEDVQLIKRKFWSTFKQMPGFIQKAG